MRIKEALASLKQKYGQKAIHPVQVFPDLLEGTEIEKHIATLQKYGFTEEQIGKVFELHPQALTGSLEFRVKNTKSLLTNYFQMADAEANAAIARFPFLLMVRHHRYIESVKFLASRGVPISTLREMLFSHVDLFDMGSDRLSTLFAIPERWGVSRQTVLRVVLENVEYLTQCPNEMIFKKIDIMNDFKIPQRIARTIFEEHPQVLLGSIHSLDAKLILVNERLKIPLEASELFPSLLPLNYNAVLRPRAETVLKYSLELSRAQFEGSDEDFCYRNGVPLEAYQAEKRKYKITNERDVKKKFYTPTLNKILSQEASS